jgi:universal stress protein A
MIETSQPHGVTIMASYRHILLAVDFGDHITQVTEQAMDLAARYQADVTLLHVVENIPISDAGYGPIVPFDIDLTQQLVDTAEQRMGKLAEQLGVDQEQTLVEVGSPKSEIIRIAEENDVDLIVIGSHGRHGLGLLLGSTASSVIHHARCDVLAVRLRGD